MTRRLVPALVAAAAALAALVVPAPAASAAPGPFEAPQWWFDDWGVPAIWAGGARGQGIVIAEIDSGVNAEIDELEGKILPGRDFGDPSQDGRVDQDREEFGHGTAMASLMVAEPDYGDITGLAPDARILPISVPLLGTVTTGSTASTLPDAIRWAVDNGAKIISMSLGQPREEGVDPVPCPVAEQDAITYAISKGAIVVAASGNEGEEGSPVLDPGVCIGVVVVGAVDDDDQVASFSSRHPYLTLTAPGVEIPTLSRVQDEAYIGEGTSQATAITSAGLALVWSKYPDLTNHQVVARVLATLRNKVATPTADPAYGFGLLHIGDAINASVPADAPNALLDAVSPFLDQLAAEETETVPEEPAPAANEPAAVEEFVVAERPSPYTQPVLQGAAVAAAGLVLLLALLVVGVVRRRRYVRWRREARAAHAGQAEAAAASF